MRTLAACCIALLVALAAAFVSTTEHHAHAVGLRHQHQRHSQTLQAAASPAAPDPDAIPGAGYGVANCACPAGATKCREYTLGVVTKTDSMTGSSKFFTTAKGTTNKDVDFLHRAFVDLGGNVNDNELAKRVCGEYDSATWLLGPCLVAKPGETVYIRLVNKFDDRSWWGDDNVGDALRAGVRVGPSVPTPDEWLTISQPGSNTPGGYGDLMQNGYTYYNTPFTNVSQYGISPDVWVPGQPWNPDVAAKTKLEEWQIQNMPGADTSFNFTNIHLHGMEVVPHLFDPMGTSNQSAPWISTKPVAEQGPDEQGHESYCYPFTIPDEHPSGASYWYHVHRHGSVAAQTWNGMAGYLLIEGEMDAEFASESYRVRSDSIFAIWDPHVDVYDRSAEGKANLAYVGPFLEDQADYTTSLFMVNNEYQPTFNVDADANNRFRVLCATTENLCGFRIVSVTEEDEDVGTVCNLGRQGETFWRIGSDGILYDKPVPSRRLVMAGGLREEVLYNLAEGTYAVCQDDLSPQFYGVGPDNTTLAIIKASKGSALIDEWAPAIADMAIVPGIPKQDDILASEIVDHHNVNFGYDSDTEKVPFAHLNINNNDYTYQGKPDHVIRVGDAEEWIISSNQPIAHPLHIHVNSFQVKEVSSALDVGSSIWNTWVKEEATSPANRWRDTVIVPPYGFVRIWLRGYNHFWGKTVFHCHFLGAFPLPSFPLPLLVPQLGGKLFFLNSCPHTRSPFPNMMIAATPHSARGHGHDIQSQGRVQRRALRGGQQAPPGVV